MSKTNVGDQIEKTKLSGKETFIYCLGNIPLNILAGIFSLTYINLFWDDLGLQQVYFVIGQLIYMIVNAFNDFFLGRLSDTTNVKRWGSRRLIYIKWGGLFWGLIFFLMWLPWSYDNQIVIFLNFVIAICAFDMFLTLVLLSWYALLPELTESLAERNKIQFFNQILGSIGSLVVIMSMFLFETNFQSFQMFCLVVAIGSAIVYFVIGSKLKERPGLYKDIEVPGLWQSIKETLKSKSFQTYVGYNFFVYVNLSMSFSFTFAYLYIMGVEIFTALMLFYLFGVIFGWLGSLSFLKLSKRTEMQTLVVRGRIITIILNIIGFFVVILPGMDFAIWVFFALTTIFGGYGLFNYPYLMMAIDEDEVLSQGTRREGMFIGINAFLIKFGESIGPIIATSVLLFFGFVRAAPTQTAEALFGIKFLFFIVPSISATLGLIVIHFYPLKGDYLLEMREKLLKLHEMKEKATPK